MKSLPLALVSLFLGASLLAESLDNWQWRSPLPQGNDIYGLAYGDGLYVAVGDYGNILTSANGLDWTVCSLESDFSLQGVTYGDGRFVAVGSIYEQGDVILTSTEGLSWTQQTTGATNGLRSVVWGNGRFVAVGSVWDPVNGIRPRILTSTNAQDWILSLPAPNVDLLAVTWGQGTFVAVGGTIILYSDDGLSWQTVLSPTNGTLMAVDYAAGRFVAVGTQYGYGLPVIMHSTNGREWVPGTYTSLPAQTPICDLVAVTYGNGRFVAMGTCGNGTNGIWTSADGLEWIYATNQPTPSRPRALLWANEQFVAVGNYGNLAVSGNGETWTPISRATSNNLRGVARGNGLFVAVGNMGGNLTSPDGIDWAAHPAPTTWNLHDLTFAAGQFVAVGGDGVIVTSPDGTNWASQTSGTRDELFDVAWGNGVFVVVGGDRHHPDDDPVWYSHVILNSPDGTNWTVRAAGQGFRFHGLTYANGLFVAVGGPNTALISHDGVNWLLASPPGSYLKGVAYGNGTFVAVDESSTAYTSPDGFTWQTNAIAGGFGFDDIEFGDGVFVAVGNGGKIFSTANGTQWTPRHSPTSTNLRGLAYGDGTFVIVGNNDIILQSGTNESPGFRIIAQPLSQVVRLGSNAVISVSVAADSPVTYQWRRNGTNLPGATAATLVFSNAQYSDTGFYEVEVLSDGRRLVSDTASLLVVTADPLETWCNRSLPTTTASLLDVACANGRFVAVGASGTILTSSDGTTWSNRTSVTAQTLLAVTFGGGLYLAVGASGTILTSPDGVLWTQRTPSIYPTLYDVAYGNGMFVAGGGNIFLISYDGFIWTQWTNVPTGNIEALAYGNGLFVAVGPANVVFTSTDGLHWNQGATGFGPLFGISWDGQRFVAVGAGGLILISTNGMSWTPRASGTASTLWNVVQGFGRYVAVGESGSVLSSLDDSAWTRHNSGVGLPLYGIACGQGAFVAVGYNGTILQSQPLVPSPPVIVTQPTNQLVRAGRSFTNCVAASGSPLLIYQWWRNGFSIPGASNSTFVVTNAILVDGGQYSVVVVNPLGSVTSVVASVRVGEPPAILLPPLSQAVVRGGSVTLSLLVSGTSPLGCRWTLNYETAQYEDLDQPMSFLTITNVQTSHAVRVGVTNEWMSGWVLSGYVSITVLEDTDADGLPDEWEDSHNLNRNESADATEDADHDGAHNRAEYEAGTDCQDPLSVLKLRIEYLPIPMLSFTALSNKTYSIQYTDVLDNRPWSRLADVAASATNRTETLTDPTATSRTRFYRLVTPRQF